MAPKPYTVTRRITINAPIARVHEFINDFRAWELWSPWADIDPDMSRSYTGADQGEGAAYAWEGDRKAGKGTMKITASAAERVDFDLHFDKPFPSDNTFTLSLRPGGEGTEVEWLMRGATSGIMTLFSKFKSMDSLVGPDFERGLQSLKRQAEST